MAGALSDRFAPKPIIILLCLVLIGGNIIYVLAWSSGAIIAARVIAGVGASATAPALNWLTSVTQPQERAGAIGSFWIFGVIGMMIAPGMAVVFSYIPDILLVLRAPGYFVIATSGVCVLLYLFLFRDVSKEVGIAMPPSTGSWAPVPWGARLMFPSYFIYGFSIIAYETSFVPVTAERLGFLPDDTGYFFIGIGATVMITLIVVRFLGRCIQDRTLILIGSVLMMAGMIAGIRFADLSIPQYLALMIVDAFLVTVGYSFAVALIPTIFLRVLANHPRRGLLIGLLQSVMSLSRCLGPLWAGYGLSLGENPMFFGLIGLMVVNIIILIIAHRCLGRESGVELGYRAATPVKATFKSDPISFSSPRAKGDEMVEPLLIQSDDRRSL